MKLSQFRYHLPNELIAMQPAPNRGESRLMVLNRKTKTIEHRMFSDILDIFGDGDVFVINDTKVFPALLTGEKEKTGAKITVFLLRELNAEARLWDVLVDPARKIRIGNKLYFGDDDSLVAEVIDNTTSRGLMTSSRKPLKALAKPRYLTNYRLCAKLCQKTKTGIRRFMPAKKEQLLHLLQACILAEK